MARRGWFRRIIDRIIGHTPPPEPAERKPAPRRGRGAGRRPPTGTRAPARDSSSREPRQGLPDGWEIAGLRNGQRFRKTSHPSDKDIERADSILVVYHGRYADEYRWVHGAMGVEQLGDLITTTTVKVSAVD